MPKLLHRKHDHSLDALARQYLFRNLTRQELRQVRALSSEVDVPAGWRLCRQGGHGKEAFLVLDGSAEVAIDGEHVNEIGPGGFFGEMALLDGDPRVADVVAKTDMRLLALNRSEFRSLLLGAPSIAIRLLEGVATRLREVETAGRHV